MARNPRLPPANQHHGETIVPLLSLPPKPMVVAAKAADHQDVTLSFDGLPWGWWQARTTLLAGMAKMTTAFHMAMVLYASPPSPFGEFQSGNSSWPWQLCCGGAAQDEQEEQAVNGTPCKSWLQLESVSQWSSACWPQFVGGVSQLCYLLGVAAGGSLCLRLLPRLGPRRLLLGALAAEAVLALALAFVQVFWAHALNRFALAIASSTLFTAAAALCADLCSGSSRLLTVSLFEIWWSLGIISIAAVGSYVPNWTCLQVLVSLPSVVLLLPCALLLPESPRWLVARGLADRAALTWERGARVNGQPAPAAAALAHHADRATQPGMWACSEGEGGQCRRARHVVKLVVLHIAYGCVTNTFFGSILNVRNWGTAGMLGLAVGEAAAGTCGMFGVVLGTCLLLRSSRPLLWLGLLLLAAGGTAMFAHLVEPEGAAGAAAGAGALPRAVQLTLFALVERVAVAAAVPVLTACAPTMVPTAQRASLLFSCLLFGRLCLLAAPFVGNLVVFGEAFPLTVFGIELVVAGLSSLFLVFLGLRKTSTQKTC